MQESDPHLVLKLRPSSTRHLLACKAQQREYLTRICKHMTYTPLVQGHTALERAAAFCHVDTVKLLLSIGADYKSASTVRRYCSSTCYYHDALFAPSAHACLQKHSKSLLSLLL